MVADQLAHVVVKVADKLRIPCAIHCTFPWPNMSMFVGYAMQAGSGDFQSTSACCGVICTKSSWVTALFPCLLKKIEAWEWIMMRM